MSEKNEAPAESKYSAQKMIKRRSGDQSPTNDQGL